MQHQTFKACSFAWFVGFMSMVLQKLFCCQKRFWYHLQPLTWLIELTFKYRLLNYVLALYFCNFLKSPCTDSFDKVIILRMHKKFKTCTISWFVNYMSVVLLQSFRYRKYHLLLSSTVDFTNGSTIRTSEHIFFSSHFVVLYIFIGLDPSMDSPI